MEKISSDSIPKEFRDVSADLVSKFDTAWNNRDADSLGVLFTEDADFQFYHGIMVHGRKRIRKFYHNKVFPYLEEGLEHITRKYKIRQITDEVVIGDGRVDLVIMKDGEEKEIQKRLKVTTVVVKDGQEWKYSAVRVMVPVKDRSG